MLPPDEPTGLEAVKRVQALDGPALEKRVREEVGDPMIAFFSLLAKHLFPGEEESTLSKKVQLMILAYLIRGEVDGTSKAKPAAGSGNPARKK